MCGQAFSVISRRFSRSKKGLQTPEDLEDFLRTCYHPDGVYEDAHVEFLNLIPTWGSFFKNYEPKYMQSTNDGEYWHYNRWQFFPVYEHGKRTDRVQVNKYLNTFTTEEILRTYWIGSCHGIFGGEVMRRHFLRHDCGDDNVNRLYRDMTYELNQPMKTMFYPAWDMFSKLREEYPDIMIGHEDFAAPNIEDTMLAVRNVLEVDHPSWEAVWERWDAMSRKSCHHCLRFQEKMAPNVRRARRESAAGAAARQRLNQERAQIQREWDEHKKNPEEHLDIDNFDVVAALKPLMRGINSNEDGDIEMKDVEEDVEMEDPWSESTVHAVEQELDTWLQHEDSSSFWDILRSQCQMFTSASALQRKLARTGVDMQNLLTSHLNWSNISDARDFILMQRAWEVEDFNYEVDQQTKKFTLGWWWAFRFRTHISVPKAEAWEYIPKEKLDPLFNADDPKECRRRPHFSHQDRFLEYVAQSHNRSAITYEFRSQFDAIVDDDRRVVSIDEDVKAEEVVTSQTSSTNTNVRRSSRLAGRRNMQRDPWKNGRLKRSHPWRVHQNYYDQQNIEQGRHMSTNFTFELEDKCTQLNVDESSEMLPGYAYLILDPTDDESNSFRLYYYLGKSSRGERMVHRLHGSTRIPGRNSGRIWSLKMGWEGEYTNSLRKCEDHIERWRLPKCKVEVLDDNWILWGLCAGFPLIPRLFQKKTAQSHLQYGIPYFVFAWLRQHYGWEFVYQAWRV